jgi:hypothetical protein
VAVTLTYDDQLSRVRVDADELGVDATYAVVDRSYNGVLWTTLRGGTDVDITSGALTFPVDDYEFVDGDVATYRVRSYDAGDVLLETQTDTITPTLDTVWLKFIARPYLNRKVTVTDWSDVERASRNGVFPVVGRIEPLAITDLHTSRTFTLSLLTDTLDKASDLDLALSVGFPVYLQAPADCGIPTMYAVVGNLTQRRTSRRGIRRLFEIPLTEVGAPGPDVVGQAGSWQILLNNKATWQDVLEDFGTWGDVAELIGSPSDIIVGS